MAPSLAGKICLVTGATRGIGKGIALQLSQAGATVYITGRTLKRGENTIVGGSLEETAEEIKARGGQCVPVQCDHSKEDDVAALFERIKSDQNGRLDVLVNNAYSAVTAIAKYNTIPFWETPLSMWDIVNNVGLKNHYLCTHYAANMMVLNKKGLIVNVSSPGGLFYLFNVAYGVGKCALDRMTADTAVELRPRGVSVVTLYPGLVATELIEHFREDSAGQLSKELAGRQGESTEFAGMAVVHLATDANIMSRTGSIQMTADLAEEFGFTDITGVNPANMRSLYVILQTLGYRRLASWTPAALRIPKWALWMRSNKFNPAPPKMV